MSGSLVSFNDLTAPPELSAKGTPGLVNERFVFAEEYTRELIGYTEFYLAQIADFEFDMPWTPIMFPQVVSPGLDGIDADEPIPPDIRPIDVYIPVFDHDAPEMGI